MKIGGFWIGSFRLGKSMENSLEYSHGTDTPKKSRSLDLKSLYETKVSKAVQNENLKRKVRAENGGEQRNERRNRKKVSLSNFSSIYSRSRKSLHEVYDDELGSSGHDSKKALKSESKEKLNSSSEFNKVSLILNDDVMQIPKRKRGGFVRRKKILGGQILKPSGQLDGKAVIVDQIAKSSAKDPSDLVACCKTNRKPGFKNLKEKEQSELSSTQHPKRGDGHADPLVRENQSSSTLHLKEEGEHIDHSVVKPVSLSVKKSQKNFGKRKISASGRKRNSKEGEASISHSTKRRDGCLEDDEENLEENAARMLSSRFDPTCSGFSSNVMGSLPPANGFVSHGLKPLADLESASVDSAGRVLRPRKQRKEKKSSRKRRHFYEILLADLDAVWILNRRIKVFWPLDQIWYYGLVNDYDKERKLHHVKYDDRDEEWIDLQNERFKLLLLPSEVPGREDRRKSVMGNNPANEKRESRSRKGKETNAPKEECNTGSFMDSEPIISWLARSTQRNKSCPSHSSKRQKTSSLSLKSGSQAIERPHSGLPERLGDMDGLEKSTSEITTCSKTCKFPIVYFRKRFRTIGTEMSHKHETSYASIRTHSLASFFSNVGEIDDVEESDISPRRSEAPRLLWCVDDDGLLQLAIPSMEVGQLRFELTIPEYLFLNMITSAETFWLFHLTMLIQHGALTLTWPKVQLEMFCVDNVVGLRFLLFEGCLMQAVAFIFLVMKMFRQPSKQVRYADFQVPMTSIRFELSCLPDIGKQLVFAFYNFSETKNSKWLHLDCRLKKYCLLTKQLPLTECTYDNIKRFQNCTSQFHTSPFCGECSSVKGTQKISSLGINHEGDASENNGHSNLCSNETNKKFPAFALSFTAAPSFMLSLHLKLLMKQCVAHLSSLHQDSGKRAENFGRLTVDNVCMNDCANSLSTSSKALDRWNLCAQSDLGTGLSDCEVGGSSRYKRSRLVAETCAGSQDSDKARNDVKKRMRSLGNDKSAKAMALPNVARSDNGSDSFLNDLSVEIPSFQPVDGELHNAQLSMDVAWNVNSGIIRSPNPTAPRSTWHRNKNNSSSFGLASHGWSDGKDFLNGLGNRTKKPRTQVSYMLPFGGLDYGSKNRNSHPKATPYKRIRRASEKRSDAARGSQRNLELLSCDANVLITTGDRGWRECGARVVLEVFDHDEWKLAVKLSGITKYSYKAHQFLQPGSTNRYTHAMMWKGGKDWILEFPDRSQWTIFKELHEECYNRNVRAASVKNIPIPGVRLIEENDEHVAETAFMRNPSKYFRQVETDVEMALNPNRVLYDMDSDDEQWIKDIQTSSEVGSSSSLGEVSSEVFVKTMDAFEKAAYSQQRDEFTDDEIAEAVNETLVSGLTKGIFEYWQLKRRQKGMPLLRHLQPPLWETYQQQLKDWESTVNKNNTNSCNGCHESASIEKPPMFAFCLKPRGLEVSNKGSKQRSHRKFSMAGHSNSITYDQDGLHGFVRRLNGSALGDDRMVYLGHNYEFLEDSPLIHTSSSLFSPRLEGGILSNDGFERNVLPKLHKTKSRKYGASPYEPMMASSFNQRMVGKRDGLNRWNNGYSEWSSPLRYRFDGSQRQILEQLEGSDLDEYRFRDVSGAAQEARNVAKFKREKARRLLIRADLAIHKAVVAIMTAEAMKAAFEDNPNGDG
ncbi:uncharacterized protein LOC111481016 [Cucurbita maxima]|uniref:Enhancer of polycomb-like protein n=1 Tax=Cucurbita maxima TaxID=3661 RepID=A0A6J1IY87_CUCMA|nr:uncharacterized protein LOC111481016 [Cucurbita maxima]XP_022982052.1 uncharacterized protein LOC111481016 [Cucurbita maxima]XP_022982053.1 uncharacterized protein LOC111481016 [Cucurbita maxima]